jgi:hypothetical protein
MNRPSGQSSRRTSSWELKSFDRVFQEFATDLSRFAGQENPLREAAPSLRGRQRSTVIMALGTLRYGVKPTISLPPNLLSNQRLGTGTSQDSPDRGTGVGHREGGGRPTGTGEPPRLKSVTVPETWRLPSGKSFGDFFNTRTGEETRANLAGWPMTAHNKTGSQKPVCVRLMFMGKCLKENCKHSHIKPTSLSPAIVATITTRVAQIYQG